MLAVMPLTEASATPTCIQNIDFRGQEVPASFGDSVTCLLRTGNDNTGVVALQDALRFCSGHNIKVDGDFGSKTRAALVRVQRRIGVAADGEYGPITLSHMRFVSAGDIFPGCRPVG